MAYMIRNLVVLSTLFLVLAITPNIEAKEVVVEAMVYCQSCDHIGTWSLTEAKPVASAKVSVTCKSHKGQVFYYKVFDTDNNGYMYAELKGFKMQDSILDPLHSCYVKLVWSPLETCGLLSNVNYGLSGAPLRYENKQLRGGAASNYYEAVVYAAGPLAFRPTHSHCSHAATPRG